MTFNANTFVELKLSLLIGLLKVLFKGLLNYSGSDELCWVTGEFTRDLHL